MLKTVDVDWLSSAWSHYLCGDTGVAAIAARRAREEDSSSIDAYLVSAWVELSPVTTHPLDTDDSLSDVHDRCAPRDSEEPDPTSSVAAPVARARRWADEAYALDGGQGSAAVMHVRGVCFYFDEDFSSALQAYREALSATDDPGEQAELHLRAGLALEASGDANGGLFESECALEASRGVPPGVVNALMALWSRMMIAQTETLSLDKRAEGYQAHRRRIETRRLLPQVRAALVGNCQVNANRVAAYVRAHEDYSLAHEQAAILRFAAAREMSDLRRKLQRIEPRGSRADLLLGDDIDFYATELAAIRDGDKSGMPILLGLRRGWKAKHRRYVAAQARLAALPTVAAEARRAVEARNRAERRESDELTVLRSVSTSTDGEDLSLLPPIPLRIPHTASQLGDGDVTRN